MRPRYEPLVIHSKAQQADLVENPNCAIDGCERPRIMTGKTCQFHGVLWRDIQSTLNSAKQYERKKAKALKLREQKLA